MKVKPYTIVLADDHVMFRQGIKVFIEKIEGVQVSGEFNNGDELMDSLQTSLPDLIVLDIAMPRLRGLEALRLIKKLYPQVKVLILSMYGTPEFVRQALADGAEGFILKEEPSNELVQGIKALRRGDTYFSPKLAGALKNIIADKNDSDCLTGREREVLQYLARGRSSQEIAEELYISIHTVRRHRYNILQKLNLKHTTDLIRYAISHGLV